MGRKAKPSHGKDDVQCATCSAWHPEEDTIRCDQCGAIVCPNCFCEKCDPDDDSDIDEPTDDWLDDEGE